MLLTKASSIREVIAFPKTQKAQCLLTDAPSPVDGEQLESYLLELEKQIYKFHVLKREILNSLLDTLLIFWLFY